MIINELAYKVTIKADEFLNGKRKLKDEVKQLEGDFDRSGKNISRTLKSSTLDVTQFGSAAASSFRGAYTAAAGFLGIGAGLYGIKQLFTSTSNEIVRASNQAKFFGTDVNKMFGMRRGFQQAGLNGDAFIGASGNARMALANIKDPTIFGGLTGAAQNLMVLGARTGLNINNLGDPNKALSEFTRYGKGHSQENLMQVMAAAGFDPTDAAKIKSGELKSLVDSETKKSNITAAQVKEQENLLVTLGQLDAQFARIRSDLAIAFAPEVMSALKQFGDWIKDHHGDIIGFFRDAGESVKKLTDSVGGANALLLLLAAGLRSNPLVMAAIAATTAANAVDKANEDAKNEGKNLGDYMYDKVHEWKTPFLTWDDVKSFFGFDEPEQHAQSARRKGSLPNRNNNPGNLRPSGASSGFRSFSSEQEGWDAMSNQLMMYFNGTSRAAGFKKLRTVNDIINKWAPPSENDTGSYVKEVASYMGVGANDEINLADPNVMARLRTAMARREGFGNWKNGLKIGGANQFQNEYYLQQQRWANTRPSMANSSIDNSQQSSININTMNINSNPQSVDALAKTVNQQAGRASTNAAFSSSVR
ncbi:lytic transglycosylase domain-containing protein [Citrobacter freundii]|uniref:lytic transglycosylase domain-containing protein n=1 Tax=Citrobacter freundii TaxID=546 RepID=UPI0015E9567B|nr:lytic transglycosylase domain-containing protein [Citrobacter freundii]QLU15511.1 lytic transglycosylase domain-containing protein [Citrobacter freundii]